MKEDGRMRLRKTGAGRWDPGGKEKVTQAIRAMGGLTPRQLACLARRVFDGLDYRRIGEAEGICGMVAWRHVRQAVKKLARAGVRLPAEAWRGRPGRRRAGAQTNANLQEHCTRAQERN